jgi:hypothetical protein
MKNRKDEIFLCSSSYPAGGIQVHMICFAVSLQISLQRIGALGGWGCEGRLFPPPELPLKKTIWRLNVTQTMQKRFPLDFFKFFCRGPLTGGPRMFFVGPLTSGP